MKGKELEHIEYEQLLPFIDTNTKAFFVTCADYVTTEDGTGIVILHLHLVKMTIISRRYNLPVLQPVDDEGKFMETPWEDKFVMDADQTLSNG